VCHACKTLLKMITDKEVYTKVGMALISAQRVESITKDVLNHLKEFDKDVYGITTNDFLNNSEKSKKARLMLGEIFKQLKLNPKLVIENELDIYLKKRNLLVHNFYTEYLISISDKQVNDALEFCDDFGRNSMKIEAFFRGFIFFLALRHVPDRYSVNEELKLWENDFDYFITSLNNRALEDVKIL
jgi:hypothetical protein